MHTWGHMCKYEAVMSNPVARGGVHNDDTNADANDDAQSLIV